VARENVSKSKGQTLPSTATGESGSPVRSVIPTDPFRAIVFPNHLREQRRLAGIESLLALADAIPTISYIRLSKIERGEVVAKADELRAIAAVLKIVPQDLLVDIADPQFVIARWATRRGQQPVGHPKDEEQAILLAAAFRKARQQDRNLSLMALETRHGLAPVIVSRIEHALKPPGRWNLAIRAAICQILGVEDNDLETSLARAYQAGVLDEWIARVPGAAHREGKTIAKVAELREQLSTDVPSCAEQKAVPVASATPPPHRTAMLPVYGVPLPDGLLAKMPTSQNVESPAAAGPSAFGLRLCRPTLGSGMPGNAIMVVDPDVMPSAGGLAVLNEIDGLRAVTLATDREGRLFGHSAHPNKEIAIDTLRDQDVYSVLAVYFF
jgi:transcriptional regulator with XRE-family HTH domain